jgi:hypothetical protein
MNSAFPQEVIERFQFDRSCDRGVGKHQIQALNGKFGQQAFGHVFLTNQLHIAHLVEHGCQDTVTDQFRQNIGSAYPQFSWSLNPDGMGCIPSTCEGLTDSSRNLHSIRPNREERKVHALKTFV